MPQSIPEIEELKSIIGQALARVYAHDDSVPEDKWVRIEEESATKLSHLIAKREVEAKKGTLSLAINDIQMAISSNKTNEQNVGGVMRALHRMEDRLEQYQQRLKEGVLDGLLQ